MPSERITYSQRTVGSLPNPNQGRDTYTDPSIRYLKLWITPTAKTWYYVRRLDGQTIQHRIGTWPDTSVTLAKEAADKCSAKITLGEPLDPEPAESAPTIAQLWTIYNDRHVSQLNRPDHPRNQYRLYIQKPFGKQRADTITGAKVAAWHHRITKQHGDYAANRALSLLRALYNYHIKQGALPPINPARAVSPNPERKRKRYLTAPELQRLFRNLDGINIDIADIIQLLLWTAARKSNVLAMRWSQIDLSAATWMIPGEEAKESEPIYIHLVAPALDILNRRHNQQDSDFVFPSSKSKTGHIVSIKKAWATLISKPQANLPGIRPHDLRRTMASWQAAGGASLQVIGKALGHRSSQSTEVYSHLDLTPVRQIMDRTTEAIVHQINIKSQNQYSSAESSQDQPPQSQKSG